MRVLSRTGSRTRDSRRAGHGRDRHTGTGSGLGAVTGVHEGSPSETIVEYAGNHGIDMIVMGTQGRTGLDRYLLGSTAARVLRRAELPVLTVKPDGERAEREVDEE